MAVAAAITTEQGSPRGIRFVAFAGGAVVYIALATMNAWPNLDAAMHGDTKAAAMAMVQYVFAFIIAISSVASAHEKGGQAAVIVFMLVNGYFAYDASSHRHDEAKTTSSRKAILDAELTDNEAKRRKLGEFDRVSGEQVEAVERKLSTAHQAANCTVCYRSTMRAGEKAAKDAQGELDRLMPLRTKTVDADNLDKAITQARAELKALKATGDSDNSLASMAGTNAATLTTGITLLLALGIELANKYGPYWTFRFVMGGLGFHRPSPHEQRNAEKAKAAEEEAEKQAKAARAAKRATAKTVKPGSVKAWLGSSRVVQSRGHTLDTTAAYADYAAFCRDGGEVPVSRGKQFIGALRDLGVDVQEQGKRKRFLIAGLTLTGGLRLVA
jgi:hypothetical protein